MTLTGKQALDTSRVRLGNVFMISPGRLQRAPFLSSSTVGFRQGPSGAAVRALVQTGAPTLVRINLSAC